MHRSEPKEPWFTFACKINQQKWAYFCCGLATRAKSLLQSSLRSTFQQIWRPNIFSELLDFGFRCAWCRQHLQPFKTSTVKIWSRIILQWGRSTVKAFWFNFYKTDWLHKTQIFAASSAVKPFIIFFTKRVKRCLLGLAAGLHATLISNSLQLMDGQRATKEASASSTLRIFVKKNPPKISSFLFEIVKLSIYIQGGQSNTQHIRPADHLPPTRIGR